MNFIDQDDCNIPFDYEDDMIFPPCYENIETPEHSKSTDLEQKFKNDRKERILKKRIEKKHKTKSESNNNLSKEELRKLRNRNSAQQSRDRKKQQFDSLILENQNYQMLLKQKEDQIQLLMEENNQQRLKIQYLEELNQNYKCMNCAQEASHEMIRVNVITKQKMMNYGLLSLLAITCILSIVNNDYEFSPKPISLHQISHQKYDFLAPKQQFSNSTQLAIYNNLAIPEHQFNNQTLFYNCTGNEKECQTFLNIIKAENANNLYFVNDASDQIPATQDHHFDQGENVYLIKIKQDDEDNFMIFRAKCQITESNKLLFERDSYDSFNNNSLQY
ncbi:unnamed protein product [Paramecium pentaurelia]|uniref:BZIP domain-containing protein n=1 Tax=Paramecium pentaurelia TaxID=43138 RepID=A0A8S1TXF0_9CILI|nr:unnamed protein product [Paramecium pentaurelia]